jgi:hypothetical protein
MKNLNEEVNKIKHLFNFKKGDVITESLLNEQEEEKKLNPTYQKPLCNNMSGTYGTGKETEFNACVYKIGPSSYVIELRDKNGNKIFTDGGDTWSNAVNSYFNNKDKREELKGKKVGIDLPTPINPDDEASVKYYYEDWVKSN